MIVVRYGQEVIFIRLAEKSPRHGQQDPPTEVLDNNWITAVRAAQSKKAQDVVVLDLREITSLADYFLICTGNNTRQNQAISDEIYLKMKDRGEMPVSIEGYENAEWILQDYGDFIVHIFLPASRSYYDLERLWRHAKNVPVPSEEAAPSAH
jgi:ribosome-associated protein